MPAAFSVVITHTRTSGRPLPITDSPRPSSCQQTAPQHTPPRRVTRWGSSNDGRTTRSCTMVYWLFPEAKGAAPPARGGCACAAVGSKVVFFGGADRATQAYSDIWALETGGGAHEWMRITAETEEGLIVHPRSGATLTTIGDKLYLYGGQDIATGMCHKEMLVLDTLSWRWSRVELAGGKQPPPRHSHCAGKLADNSILVFGGVGEGGHLDDVWVFNTAQAGWTAPSVGAAKPRAREMHSGTMLDATTMLVYGGRDAAGRVLDDAAILDMAACSWRSVEPTPFSRCAHSAAAMPRADVLGADAGGSPTPLVVIYGGFSGEAVQGDVFYIDPDTSEVEIVRRGPRPSDPPTSRVPVPRFAHSATCVPVPGAAPSVEMVVFGGVNPSQDLADMAVLRCGEEAEPMDTVPDSAGGRTGAVVEELDPDSDSKEIASSSSLIQHQEGLVELKISEA
eukprot:jgi/Tetstr1/465344/TSEL_010030.t1